MCGVAGRGPLPPVFFVSADSKGDEISARLRLQVGPSYPTDEFRTRYRICQYNYSVLDLQMEVE